MRAAVDHLHQGGRLRGLLRRVFWSRRCSIMGPKVTWPKPRTRSIGWRRPADDGLVIREIWLLRLRALLARAHGDAGAYAHLRDRYCAMAESLGFEGHIAWAEAMIEVGSQAGGGGG